MEKLVGQAMLCRCGKFFKVVPSEIRRGRKYCSLQCYWKYREVRPWNKGKKASEKTKKRLSESQKLAHKRKNYGFKKGELVGNKNPAKKPEIRKKISEGNKKEKHWNWQGGITGKDYPEEWNRYLKERVKERDGFTCQICGVKGVKLNVHHINHNKKDCSLSNLTTWCTSCHMRYHNGKR